MRKILSIVLLCLIFASSAFAEKPIQVLVNGEAVAFDVPPQIIDGRTYVPFRAIMESLNMKVEWYGDKRAVTATNKDYIVTFTVGEKIISVNFADKEVDAPPVIVNDRMLIPVRHFAEAFSYDVEWDGENRIVEISFFEQLEYYYATTIPDYRSFSNRLLVNRRVSEDGVNSFYYELTEEVFDYLTYLSDNGWYFEDKVEKDDYSIYFMSKGVELVSVVIDYANMQTVIMYK